MKIETETVTVTETTKTIELSTDDIETLLGEKLKLSGNAKYNWSVGQWVSLSIIDVKKETL